MNFRTMLLAVATIFLLSVGQVLFKLSATRSVVDASRPFVALGNGYLVVALLTYAIATMLWVIVLRELPLRVAYPFAALAFIVVPLLGHFFLGETLKWTTMLGALLILFGVWVSVQ